MLIRKKFSRKVHLIVSRDRSRRYQRLNEQAKFNKFFFFFLITFHSVMDRKTPELRPAINEYFKDPSPSSNLFDDISSHAAADNKREEPAVCRIFQQIETKKTDIFDIIKPVDADGHGNSPGFDVRDC